jgi:glycine dehydrogenase subunit 1
MRYLPHNTTDRKAMLEAIGVDSIESLFRELPATATFPHLPTHKFELEVERHIAALAAKNTGTSAVPSFLGAGAYRHHIPASVDHLIQRGEFLTSYTPYQPEISQGTLQMLFEFQTLVCQITGMEVANASMYDGATACAEAVLVAMRVTGRSRVDLSQGLHPHYRETVETTLRWTNHANEGDLACKVVQTPDFFGNVQDVTKLAEECHTQGALLIVVVTEIVSLGLLPSPGSMGADIVVGEGQSLGNPLSFGGPHLGLFATRDKYVRQMPGRICGETVDADGKRGWVLTLSTREQHIRREKATSNICTNSGLCALAFTIHLALLGEDGFKNLARVNHHKACQLADKLSAAGLQVVNDSFFNEFVVELPTPAAPVVEKLAAEGILAGVPLSRFDNSRPNALLIAATEMTTEEEMEKLVSALKNPPPQAGEGASKAIG